MLFLGCQARRGKPQCVSGSIHCISGFLTAPHFLHLTSLLFPDKLFLIFTIHFKPTIPSCLLLILAGAITPNFTERNKATRTFSLKFRIFIPTCLLHWESFGQYSFFLVPSSFFERFIFNWRIFASKYCAGFCHTSTCISHRYTYVPSFLNLPPTSLPTPLDCHRALNLSSLHHIGNSYLRIVSMLLPLFILPSASFSFSFSSLVLLSVLDHTPWWFIFFCLI